MLLADERSMQASCAIDSSIADKPPHPTYLDKTFYVELLSREEWLNVKKDTM